MSGDHAATGGPLLAYFGHHKCATQWMNRIVQQLCDATGRERFRYSSATKFGGDLGAAIDDHTTAFVCYVNADYRMIGAVPALRAFHMVRDPRDVVVSAYFSHVNTHPTDDWPALEAHRQKLEHLSLQDGLMAELDWRATQFKLMTAWDYDNPDILEIRMEDATTDTDAVLRDVVEHLGIIGCDELDENRLSKIIARSSFNELAGREPGVEDRNSHYRKGVSEDWRNYFDAALTDDFKARHNDLLLKLGYETDSNWTI